MKSTNPLALLSIVFTLTIIGCGGNNAEENQQDIEPVEEVYTETPAFTFDDGETVYELIEGKLIEPDSTNPIKLYTRVEPALVKRLKVLEKPIIDTIRDAGDPSIILFIDTAVAEVFKYYREIPYSYANLVKNSDRIKQLSEQQGLKFGQAVYIVMTKEGFNGYYLELPTEEELLDATRVLATYKLKGEKYLLKYPVLYGL